MKKSDLLVVFIAVAGLNVFFGANADCLGSEIPPVIYERSTNMFLRARLVKPTEPESVDLNFKLAPLILQQVSDSSSGLVEQDQFGQLRSVNGQLGIDPGRQVVYVKSDTVRLSGASHPSVTYVWFYSANSRAQRKESLIAQGVRITLDSSGKPGVWEILGDPSTATLIFVSQSVEAAAFAQYGPPLTGRRHAVERGLQDCPKVIVPRVIEDGPAIMGPILYLSAGTRSVSTLICRCMPAQAREVVSTGNYDLIPAEGGTVQELIRRSRGISKPSNWLWSQSNRDGARLEKSLRFPAVF